MSRQHRFPTALGVPPPSLHLPFRGGFGRGGGEGGSLCMGDWLLLLLLLSLCLYVLLLLDTWCGRFLAKAVFSELPFWDDEIGYGLHGVGVFWQK